MSLREKTETWPSLKVELELLPWHWYLQLWRDRGLTSSFELVAGPLRIGWYANRPAFSESGDVWTEFE